MKKRDVIQLVKEIVKENTFYGNRDQPSQLSTGTKVSVPTDEYPFSAKPKRTATGMMEEEYTAEDQWDDFNNKEKAEVLDDLGKDGYIILQQGITGYDEVLDDIMKGDNETFDAAILGTPLKEFKQPKSFDSDTIRLVREMLKAADIYHNDLVDADTDKVSSFLDERSGGTYFVFPHFNGPQGRGAMFGKETTDQIDRSKAAAKAAALKTYTQFKTYIEDHEISYASPTGVYGNIYLFVMFNKLAKDYTAPIGGTQSSQFEEIDEAPMFRTGIKQDMAPKEMAGRIKDVFNKVNGAKHPVRTPEWHKNRFKDKYGISFPERLKDINKDQALAMNKYANDMTIKEKNYYGKKAMDDMMKDPDFGTLSGDAKDQAKKDLQKGGSVSLEEEPEEYNMDLMRYHGGDRDRAATDAYEKEYKKTDEISYDDAKEKGLDNPDKADISKDKDISDYELKRGMAIQKAMDDQEKNEGHMELTNDIGKDDYVDDEGRMAKSQMYKTGKYAMKLHDMLDDMEQLPAWVQAKLTKASDYLSAVYHYLDYEFVRRGDNLMEHVDKYHKRTTLMESATKKLYHLFSLGKSNEQIRNHYLENDIDMPESFVEKLRKNYNDQEEINLEKKQLDQEAENLKPVRSNTGVAGMEGGEEGMEEEKQLASGIFNETK
jgi:hypothetical protein